MFINTEIPQSTLHPPLPPSFKDTQRDNWVLSYLWYSLYINIVDVFAEFNKDVVHYGTARVGDVKSDSLEIFD